MSRAKFEIQHPRGRPIGQGAGVMANPDARQFEAHMRPSGTPLVVTGWMHEWPCMQKWTFPFFKEYCGDDMVAVNVSVKNTYYNVQVSIVNYVDYILGIPGNSLAKVGGLYDTERPFYCYSYKPFERFPELLQDFSFPCQVGDWFRYFNSGFKQRHFPQKQGWILLGGRGVISDLHTDSHSTITCLAQVEGVKRFFLFSPKDNPYLYNGQVDPLNPDYERFPLYEKATPVVVDVKAGEMVFLPPNWWHHVVALEPSITLVWPLVNHINLGDYLAESYKGKMRQCLAAIPGMLPVRAKS